MRLTEWGKRESFLWETPSRNARDRPRLASASLGNGSRVRCRCPTPGSGERWPPWPFRHGTLRSVTVESRLRHRGRPPTRPDCYIALHNQGPGMLYQIYEAQRSLMEPFADFAQAAAKLYSN